jgi:hypothetical protein
MQRKTNASLDFIELSPARKIPIGTSIISSLTTNAALFPALPLTTTQLGTLTTAFANAIAAAESGDHVAKQALITAEKNWDAAFRKTAGYVSMVADGNEETIVKGGFTPTKNETQPTQLPGACKNVAAMAERGKGTLSVGCDADNSVKAYLYVACPDSVTVTQDGNMLVIQVGEAKLYVEADTHRKLMMHNLGSGVKLNVSMMPFNNAGCGPLSNAETVIPQ